ncbi:TipAS antibiotic-recognition domain-containing protein, partial [Clostridioides difficile]|uniref:TipAS antibiotic-recognition domain-containing protein n=1 Tax=Clostridioides difficile TaxID=1496 RepID=UPI002ED58010
EDRNNLKKIAQLEDGEKVTIKAVISSINTFSPKEGMTLTKIDENEKNYGTEIREKYGKDIIDTSNKKLKNMSKQDYENWQNL